MPEPRLSGNVAGLVTAVVLALLYRNAWALVISMVAAQSAETICSYWVRPFPGQRFELDWPKAREMFRFGRWMGWNQLVVFPSRYLDSVAVGRFLGASALGFYDMAGRVSLQPIVLMAGYLSGLALPVFTKLQRREDFRRAFLRSLELLATAALPVGCLVSNFALPLIRILLGERWLAIVPVVQVLIWAGVFTGISEFVLAVLLSLGRPKILTISNAIKAVLIAGLFYRLMRHGGNTGVALAVLAGSAVTFGLQMHVCCRMIDLKIGQVVRCCRPGLLASLPVLAARVFIAPGLPLTLGRLAALAVPVLLSGDHITGDSAAEASYNVGSRAFKTDDSREDCRSRSVLIADLESPETSGPPPPGPERRSMPTVHAGCQRGQAQRLGRKARDHPGPQRIAGPRGRPGRSVWVASRSSDCGWHTRANRL